ncbi:hypothetical protein ARNL5_02011 [Anaerolineae bacterium]|nr:hypothetical protein ARNL5_02011 [Anaerolineae bacterium]
MIGNTGKYRQRLWLRDGDGTGKGSHFKDLFSLSEFGLGWLFQNTVMITGNKQQKSPPVRMATELDQARKSQRANRGQGARLHLLRGSLAQTQPAA